MLLALVVVVAVLVEVASHIDLNYYLLTPGHAQPVGPLVKVPQGRGPRRSTDRSSSPTSTSRA